MWDAIVTLRRQCARECLFSGRTSVIVNEEPAANVRRVCQGPVHMCEADLLPWHKQLCGRIFPRAGSS
jgi:hypothetical protein